MEQDVITVDSSRFARMLERKLAPGAGSSLHRHEKGDALLYVLEGKIAFRWDDRVEPIGPGDSIYVPPGVLHAWKNEGSDPARILLLFRDEPDQEKDGDWQPSCRQSNRGSWIGRLQCLQGERSLPLKRSAPADQPNGPDTLDSRRKASPMQVFGLGFEILLAGKDTFGASCIYQMEIPAGAGMPPYINHRASESFYVIAGEFVLFSDGQKRYLQAGALVTIAAEVPHWFHNVGNESGVLVGQSIPAGQDELLTAMDRFCRNHSSPEGIGKIFKEHGMTLLSD
jgi:quercetin dioxygenase-like cupin family protein